MHISLLPLGNAINDNTTKGNEDDDGGGNPGSWYLTFAFIIVQNNYDTHTHLHIKAYEHRETHYKIGKTILLCDQTLLTV